MAYTTMLAAICAVILPFSAPASMYKVDNASSTYSATKAQPLMKCPTWLQWLCGDPTK